MRTRFSGDNKKSLGIESSIIIIKKNTFIDSFAMDNLCVDAHDFIA